MNAASIVGFATLAAIVVKFIDWLKQLQNKDWNGALTQLAVWVVGTVVILVAAQSQLASGIVVFDIRLGSLSVWDCVLAGLALGSSGSVGWQTIGNIGGGALEVRHPLFPALCKRQVPPPPPVTTP